MHFAFYPNRSVERVYSIYKKLGVMHNTIAVRELPPSEDFKILVRGEFL